VGGIPESKRRYTPYKGSRKNNKGGIIMSIELSSPGTPVFVAERLPLFFFPRKSNDLFNEGTEDARYGDRLARQVELKYLGEFDYFKDTDNAALPKIPNLNNLSSRTLKERELYIFDGDNSKIFTVCFLLEKNNKFYQYTGRDINDEIKESSLYLEMEENNTARAISLSYSYATRVDDQWFTPVEFYRPIDFSISGTHRWLHIKITVGDIIDKRNITELEGNTDFTIQARLKSPENSDKAISARLSITFSTYKGWTLTKTGHLQQGRNGFLYDEKNYYILKDGRRVDENIMERNQNFEKSLKIGYDHIQKAYGVREGLLKIMEGVPPYLIVENNGNSNIKYVESRYFIYDDLLKNHYDDMSNHVVIQAFQIAACYPAMRNSRQLNLGRNAHFYSYSTDETGIPIVVTVVGNPANSKKLVLAGPHGDERNAQRLIMVAQRLLIRSGPPNDTVLYFIPSLSPTMTFADIRGVLNKHFEKEFDIPTLHEGIQFSERKILQEQVDPVNHPVGIDANRDYHLKFKSSFEFHDFIIGLKNFHTFRDRTTTTSPIAYRDFYDNNTEIAESLVTINNFRVLMIHGYDSTQTENADVSGRSFNAGSVYGPYYMHENWNKPWSARMSIRDKMYVNNIREKLDWGSLDRNYVDLVLDSIQTNDPFFYSVTEHDPYKYLGEWSWHLKRLNIWSADIELPQGALNEGFRGIDSTREYNHSVIGNFPLLLIQFLNLVDNFPWDIPELPA
jgi:hypothetical protein